MDLDHRLRLVLYEMVGTETGAGDFILDHPINKSINMSRCPDPIYFAIIIVPVRL
jgi:hypothetical protein